MITRTGVSEKTIRQEHPEAFWVEESKQLLLTLETLQERMQAAATKGSSRPDVVYRV
jgi:ATP-dependent DNA ligase